MTNQGNPIRVLHVVGRMHKAGIETMLMNLYRNIDREKVQFDFLTHYGVEADYNSEIRELGGRIFDMPAIKKDEHVYYGQLFNYRRALKKFFQEHSGEFAAVHGHLTQLASIYFPMAKKYGKVECLIAHSHNSQSRSGFVSIVSSLLQRPVQGLATNYFACSLSAAKWLYSEDAINEGKVVIINNAIEASQYRFSNDIRIKVRRDLNLTNNFVILHVGRFEKQKNQNKLIEIFREIYKTDESARLLLVGTGPDAQDVSKRIHELGLQNVVKLLGVRSDIPDLMQAADVFIMPSLYEGLPLTAIEAQASGLPCVFSDTISREVAITPDIAFESLDSDEREWCKTINNLLLKSERNDTFKYICDAGYNIADTAQFMEKFYLDKEFRS